MALTWAMVILAPALGQADIDDREYELNKSARSLQEGRRIEREFRAAREREAVQERIEADAESRRLAAERAAWEALPYPVRLTRTRCISCHTEDNYLGERRNRIGWELVILRMQYLNDAELQDGERGVIASHLAASYPQTTVEALAEAARQLGVVLLPVALWLGWSFTRSRRSDRS
jgi:hypothetical protein